MTSRLHTWFYRPGTKIVGKGHTQIFDNRSYVTDDIMPHDPSKANITLDKEGYADVVTLCNKLQLSQEELKMIVDNNDKKRFVYNQDQTLIRASQGHSLKNVDVKLQIAIPPQHLYHGTKDRFIKSILEEGLTKQKRQYVHLSADLKTANIVAGRRPGLSTIIMIEAMRMRGDGHKFYLSDNGVWLTDHVPPRYMEILE